MKIVERVPVPTGDILVVEGEHGLLEMLSIGDYGKDVNLKCDAMGLTRKPSQVRHTEMLPLEDKWVITISTQYGCSMNCNFCDVPSVGPGRNATNADMIQEILTGIRLHPEVEYTDRLNIHFARMGEPTWNPNVINTATWARSELSRFAHVHPVVSTMMPKKNKWLYSFIRAWMDLKNNLYEGEAGLQLSINSTSELERDTMFGGNACTLCDISRIMKGIVPRGRKITLNFAVADYCVDPQELLRYFNPEHYIIKLTPMHKTYSALDNNIKTEGDYTTIAPYEELEDKLKKVGYDVLVFIASVEEDEGRITCGNAILSGTRPFDISYSST